MRRAIAIGLLLGIGLPATGFGLWSGVQSGLGREWIVSALAAELAGQLGARVEIGAIPGALHPDLRLDRVAIVLPSGARIEAATTAVRWGIERGPAGELRLRLGTVEVTGLDVAAASLEALALEDGTTETTDAGPSPSGDSGAPLRVVLEEIAVRDGTVRLESLPALRFSGRVRVDPADLRPLAAQVEGAFDPGSIGEVALEAGQIRGSFVAPNDFRLQASIETDAGDASFVALPVKDGAAGDDVTLSGAVRDLDLAAWLGHPAWASRLDGPFSLRTNALSDPAELTAQVEIDFSGTAPRPEVDRVAARAELRGERWTVGALRIAGRELRVEGQGSGTGWRLDGADLSGEVSDLEAIAAATGVEVAGAARFAAQVRGEWPNLTGSLSLTGERVVLSGVALGAVEIGLAGVEPARAGRFRIGALRLSALDLALDPAAPRATIDLGPEIALVDPLALRFADGSFSIRGRATAEQLRDVELRFDALALDRLKALWPQDGALDRVAAARLSGVAKISGAVARPVVDVELRATGGRYGDVTFELVALRAGLDEATASGSVRVEFGGAGATSTFALPAPFALLEAASPWPEGARVTTELQGVPLALVAALAGPEAPDISGGTLAGSTSFEVRGGIPRGSASLVARGIAARPSSEMSVVLDEVAMKVDTPGNRLRAEVSITAEESVRLEALLDAPHPLRLEPGETWLTREDFRLRAKTRDWDARMAAAFLPRMLRGVEGPITGELELRGGREPDVRGRIAWAGGSARVPALGQTFAPIDLALAFEQDRITLTKLELGPPSGSLTGTGTISLGEGGSVRAAVETRLDGLALVRTRELRADLSGDLVLSGGSDGALAARGRLALRDARIQLPDELDLEAAEIRLAGTESDGVDASDTPAAPIGLDIELEVPPTTRLVGEGLDAQIQGRIAVQREPRESLHYFGDLRIVRGTYRLYQARFEIERGEARLDGGTEFDPLLDVRAVARVAGTDIIVTLASRASNPLLVLSSDPPRPESDLFALILLGRSMAQLEPSEVQSLGQTVSDLGNQFALSALRERVRRFLPLDLFEASLSEDGKAKIEVGKELREGVFVKYGREVGSDKSDEAGVELEINESVRVKGSASRSGEGGADIIWSTDY